MAFTDIYKFFRTLEDDHIILSFKGNFSSELLNALLHLMEAKMNELNIDLKQRKRVLNVLVESLQNLYHHIDSKHDFTVKKSHETALVLIKYFENKFIIQTGNYIENKSLDELKGKLQEVNSLNYEELRGLYKMKLKNNSISTKGTAGLGLIDIARKSKNKLDFHFIPVNKTSSFFCLKVVVE